VPIIYLDNNATTPLDERVLEAMLPYLREHYGNPSSAHAYGWTAAAAVDVAREEFAGAIGASADEEIFFTGGATEADNTALLGMLGAGDHLVTTATEHEAVLEVARFLERAGVAVTILPVDRFGLVDPGDLREAIRPETALVSIMLANNETGTINPVRELADVAHERGVPFHTDAAQALGKIPVDVEDLGVDLMSLSAHKCYGPKGVGALYIRRRPAPGVRRARPEPLLRGGRQERGFRSGTLNVPGIVGFGRAAALAAEALPEEVERISALRDELWRRISAGLPGARPNGHPENRLPNTLNVSFPGVPASDLLGSLENVAASAGSACASEKGEPSHVLRAMGLDEETAFSSVRFGLGRFTTPEEVGQAAEFVVEAVQGLATYSGVVYGLLREARFLASGKPP
jgi:cysteine desulfurase